MNKEELLKQLRILILASHKKSVTLTSLEHQARCIEMKIFHYSNRALKIKDLKETLEEIRKKYVKEAIKFKFILKKAINIFKKLKFEKCIRYRIHQDSLELFCKSDFPDKTKDFYFWTLPYHVKYSIHSGLIVFNHLVKRTCIQAISEDYEIYNYHEQENVDIMLNYIKKQHNMTTKELIDNYYK